MGLFSAVFKNSHTMDVYGLPSSVVWKTSWHHLCGTYYNLIHITIPHPQINSLHMLRLSCLIRKSSANRCNHDFPKWCNTQTIPSTFSIHGAYMDIHVSLNWCSFGLCEKTKSSSWNSQRSMLSLVLEACPLVLFLTMEPPGLLPVTGQLSPPSKEWLLDSVAT